MKLIVIVVSMQFEKMAKEDPFGIDEVVEGDRKRSRRD